MYRFRARERDIKKGFKKVGEEYRKTFNEPGSRRVFTSLFCEEYGMGVKKTKRVHSQFQIERNEKM